MTPIAALLRVLPYCDRLPPSVAKAVREALAEHAKQVPIVQTPEIARRQCEECEK